jgi:MoCo/4Fe-4S cofactor protein with predicted Tat translocation signal
MKRAPYPKAEDHSGKNYWRSAGELAGSPDVARAIEREFPEGAAEPPSGIGRRGFLGVMGASIALASLSGCRRPEEKILPYARPPEEVIPGKPLYFATAMPWLGSAIGLLVESHEGHPTKIEGNPRHPDSQGATTTFAQATVLDLYDPDRSKAPASGGRERSWDEATQALRGLAEKFRGTQGKGLAILTEAHRSPTLAASLSALQKALPQAKVWRWDPFARDAVHEGTRLAFGKVLEPSYDLARANIIVCLDADLLANEGSPIKQARGFSFGRNVEQRGARLNRLYAVESAYSYTGASADHRLRIASQKIPAFALAVAAELGQTHKIALAPEVVSAAAAAAQGLDERQKRWARAIAKDLFQNRGKGVIVAGRKQPAAVHAIAHAINAALDNAGATVTYATPFDASKEGVESIADLAKAIRDKAVTALVILGGNPAFDAPGDLGFADLLKAVPTSVHLSTHVDETSLLSTWHLNRAHLLETWGDVRAEDGFASVVQPLIAPLYGGKTDAELVEILAGGERKAYELVRATWRELTPVAFDFDRAWRRALHDGFLAGSVSAAVDVKEKPAAPPPPPAEPAVIEGKDKGKPTDPKEAKGVKAKPADATKGKAAEVPVPPPPAPPAEPVITAAQLAAGLTAAIKGLVAPAAGLEVTFQPDPHAWDGRFANNGWLQETPDSMHKMTWGNAAALSPKTAERLGVTDGDVLRIKVAGAEVALPAIIAPGQADESIALTVGQGRTAAGSVGNGVGVNTYPLRRTTGHEVATGAEAQKTGANEKLARTQEHFMMEKRPLVREGTVAEFARNPEFAKDITITPEEHEKTAEAAHDKGEKGEKHDEAKGPTTGKKDTGVHKGVRHLPLVELWDARTYEGHAWGMTIDLNGCIGCNACIVACQSENNVPVVGKEGVQLSREMHWLRVDRYFEGEDMNEPTAVAQPLPCQHCENAPCEEVCPVGATTHSPEGINEMTYNRCIGTKYCGNNCPFKVRHFNFFNYAKEIPETHKAQFNPDVTIRSRGVMEKCNFCVQRVNHAKIDAHREGRERVRDGEVVTACQQACPTSAIHFGDLNDRSSQVAQKAASPRAYHLLEELDIKPRVSYLARITNPNPELEGA